MSRNDEFEQILHDLETACSIHLTVHDNLGGFSGRDGEFWLKGRNLHNHPYCRYRRERRDYNNNCCRHCVTEVEKQLNETQGAIETRCWKGVRELAVPIYRNSLKTATIFAGGFRLEGDRCPLRGREARELFGSLRILGVGERDRIVRLVRLLGAGLLQMAEESAASASVSDDAVFGRKAQIERFVYQNAHRPDFDLSQLARHLCLSVSRTGHLVRESCGANFQHLLRAERLRRAKCLLLAGELGLQEVGEAVGIPNVCYFSRLFKSYTGNTPGEFRKNS